MGLRVLIVGGVAAGASAATRARRLDYDAEIIIFERSGHVSFANCGLPYYVGDVIQEREALLLQSPERFRDRFAVDVRLRHEVESIDRVGRRILVRNLDTGETVWEPYDRLILTPGASPIIPPFDGVDCQNVFFLRTMEDTDAFRACVDAGTVRRAVVVGAGFIGLETAEALTRRGVQVSVVELLDQVLAPLDEDMARRVAEHLRENGVSLYLGSAVSNFKAEQGIVTEVIMEDGRTLPADAVLLSIGVRPNTRLAREAGLTVGSSGGIQVDQHLRTTDPNIFAAGDAAEVVHAVTGRRVTVPLAGPANKHGRLAGEIAVAGKGASAAKVAATAIVQVFDLTVAVTGLSRKEAERAGIAAQHALVSRRHHVGYYPGAEEMLLKLVYEPGTRRVLGAQAIGGAGVDRRIDVIATAIHFGGTLDDLSNLDLAYAPQFGAAKDPVHIAAFVADNQERGLFRQVEPAAVGDLIDQGYQLVDVRHAEEFAEESIPGAVNIDVDELRARVGELDPDRPVLVLCEVGQRGYYAARILQGLGRRDVVNLSGGYVWYAVQCPDEDTQRSG